MLAIVTHTVRIKYIALRFGKFYYFEIFSQGSDLLKRVVLIASEIGALTATIMHFVFL